MGEGLKEPEVMQLDIELGKDVLPQGSHDVQMNCPEEKLETASCGGTGTGEAAWADPASLQDFHLLGCQRGL